MTDQTPKPPGPAGAPPRWDHFRLVVVLDETTCQACRDADGLMYQCEAGQVPPPVTHCTHRPEVDGRACRCAWEPAYCKPWCGGPLPNAPMSGPPFFLRQDAKGRGTPFCTHDCYHAGRSLRPRPAPAAPEAAPPEPAPFVASRPELGGHGSIGDFGTIRPGDLPRKAEHQAPWRWEGGDLLDANGRRVAWGDDSGEYGTGGAADLAVASPRVRELLRASPQLYSGVVALLGIVSQVFHDNWPARGLFPEDAGPICANLRMLIDSIDKAGR